MADCTCNNFPEGLGKVTFGAKVGIGKMSPIGKLQVNGPAMVGDIVAGTDPASGTGVVVNVAMPSIADEFGMVDVYSSNPPGVGVGGSINLGGKFRITPYNDYASFAKILGAKEGAGDYYNGYLAFFTRAQGDLPAEAMRITSARNVGIGTPTPSQKLDVYGNIAINGSTLISSGRDLIGVNSYNGGRVNANDNWPSIRAQNGLHVATGSVGIGTSGEPSEKLEVNGNVKAAGDVQAAQNKRVKAGDANLSSGSTPDYHWAHLGVNVWFDGANWQTDDPNRVKGLIQIENGYLSFSVSNTGTPVQWQRRLKVTPAGDVYVNDVKAINSQGYCLFAP